MNDDIFARMRDLVLAALREIVPELPDEAAAKVELTPTRDPAHGDMATNAALVAAKPARQPPAKLAAALVEKLAERGHCQLGLGGRPQEGFGKRPVPLGQDALFQQA